MERPHQAAATAADAAAAAAERTMALYDAFWFRRLVLLPSPAAAPAPERDLVVDRSARPVVPSISSHPTAGGGLRHRRTRSDEATAAAFQGLEPLRLPSSGNRARLETILSGKDGLVVAAAPQPERTRRPDARRPAGGGAARPRRRRRGRSMSELEFEEVKGLQDLGFTFSDAEVDAELASIVPGLRRKPPRSSEEEDHRATASAPPAAAPRAAPSSSALRLPEEESAPADPAPRRPYLSEAWDDEEEEVRRALRNWRIPPPGDGDELKEHLRMWAHTVASAVR